MTVYLVGSGPGDPSLLTLRAAELISAADALVHDAGVDGEVLALAPAGAPRHDVGAGPGTGLPAEEVAELLVRLGRRHERVVRLVGGDPFCFGPGGEEALALAAAEVAFEVVPGVSQAGGAAAYAGIPLTHGRPGGVSVVAVPPPGGGRVDWEALARTGATIVVLLDAGGPGEVADALLAGGLGPSTASALVEHATRRTHRTRRTTLGELGAVQVESPAVLVVGEVAALDLSSFERRPLSGWRVVVTRSRRQASTLAAALRQHGATPVEVPTIETAGPSDGGAALAEALSRVGSFDWLALSSANAVEAVFAELLDARRLAGVKVAAVGGATAGALAAHGVVADLVPQDAAAEALASSFGPAPPQGATVLVPQAAGAREALQAGLREQGYTVEVVEAYRTVRPGRDEVAAARLAGADAVTFSSPSTLEGFLESYGRESLPPVVVTIGPVTSRAVRAHGIGVDAEAREASVAGLVDALVEAAASRRCEP
ncbi:MAG TPA: uroporphyrinogen-III C-methyltransferase [Acidimicrobiales bacterium]|nr:uroporphyrinogen-III C-methyltransferase [Acidimicrobiales bacterium]